MYAAFKVIWQIQEYTQYLQHPSEQWRIRRFFLIGVDSQYLGKVLSRIIEVIWWRLLLLLGIASVG